MNFNWRDVLIRNIPIDEVVERIAGLGVPGLVLLVAMAGSPWYGGAAIVSGLATLGGAFWNDWRNWCYSSVGIHRSSNL